MFYDKREKCTRETDKSSKKRKKIKQKGKWKSKDEIKWEWMKNGRKKKGNDI